MIIRNVRVLFSSMGLLQKLMFVYVVVILIPTISIGSYTYYQSQRYIKDEAVRNAHQTIQQVKNSINITLSIAESVCANIAYRNLVLDFFSRKYSFDARTREEYIEDILPLISNAASTNQNIIYNISLYHTNSSIPEYWGAVYSDSRLNKIQWYNEFKRDDTVHTLWLYDNISKISEPYGTEEAGFRVFSLVKKIRTGNGNYLGAIALDVLYENMFSGIKNLDTDDVQFIILDKHHNILYTTTEVDKKEEYRLFGKNLSGKNGSFITKNNLYCYDNVEPLNITIVSKAPIGGLLKQTSSTSWNLILVIVFGTLLLIASTYIILKIISKKLRQIVQVMNVVATGNFNVRIPVEGNDEVGQLAKDFNILIKKINELINDVLKKETSQKDAQLMALQYQINPHFIYNTIDTFRATIELEGNYKTANALAKFGKMLRYNMSNKFKYATVMEEVQHVQNYIDIQKLKFDEMIDLKVEVPEELKEFEIIKFILQPVVENSIKHGFYREEQKIEVSISFKIEGENLVITIQDNGGGINARRLDEINYQLKYSKYPPDTGSHSDGSIGLANINERIKLFYGPRYYITLDSIPGEYTKVVIRIPYSEAGDDENV